MRQAAKSNIAFIGDLFRSEILYLNTQPLGKLRMHLADSGAVCLSARGCRNLNPRMPKKQFDGFYRRVA